MGPKDYLFPSAVAAVRSPIGSHLNLVAPVVTKILNPDLHLCPKVRTRLLERESLGLNLAVLAAVDADLFSEEECVVMFISCHIGHLSY